MADPHSDLNSTMLSLAQFFDGTSAFNWTGLSKLRDRYSWMDRTRLPLDKLLVPIEFANGNQYDCTVALRRQISRYWREGRVDRKHLAEWAVCHWGGIKSNKPETISAYAKRASDKIVPNIFEGVSTVSIILSFAYPDEFAIYNSRVSVALNAIQILAQTESGIAFPYVQGRNNVLGNYASRSGFSQLKRFQPKQLVLERGFGRARRGDAYKIYLQAIRALAKERGCPIYDLEMLMFAEAESLAGRCNGLSARSWQ